DYVCETIYKEYQDALVSGLSFGNAALKDVLLVVLKEQIASNELNIPHLVFERILPCTLKNCNFNDQVLSYSELQLENYQMLLKKAIEDEFTLSLSTSDQGAKEQKWQTTYAANCVFSFDQSTWGEQQIFHEGVCAAINYRWIKKLMSQPLNPIKNYTDLEEKVAPSIFNMEIEQTPVLIHDRIVQSTYALDVGVSMRSTLLKRDHLNAEVISNHSISSFFDSKIPNGIFHLGIYEKKTDVFGQFQRWSGAHAIGLQIDSFNNLYRFWDVNHGFYEFSTLEKLKESFKSYLESYYPTHNFIDAIRLTPLDNKV
ncbi:MAG: hypothetical protein ACRDFB_05030, partial [Rhabdochlamydiaceae bacterium]